MLPGEIGCAISHHMAYLLARKSEWEWVLILEDNIRITAGDAITLSKLLKWLSSTNQLDHEPTLIHLLPNKSPLLGRKIVTSAPVELFESLDVLRLAKGYLLNQSCLALAADRTLPITDVADWPHWIIKVKFLVTLGDLVSIDTKLNSEIGFRPAQEYQRIKRPIKRILFRAENFVKMILGIEYIIYRRNTKLNDYFQWIVINRISRYFYAVLGRPILKNHNFREVPTLILRILFSLRKGSRLWHQ
jgi:GR25 family glycosyltransferase involved in LPS biosynthesis